MTATGPAVTPTRGTGPGLSLPFPGSLLDSLVVALVGIDAEQRIRYFNPGAERMFGLDRGAAVGEPLDRLIPERFLAAHADHVRRFAAGADTTRLEYMRPRITGRRADGSEFPAQATIARYETSSGPRLLAIVRDLEDEIGIRADEDPGRARGLQALRHGRAGARGGNGRAGPARTPVFRAQPGAGLPVRLGGIQLGRR
ncbi:MAG: PAS domain S-box protein [Halofilum sp. (in: g-proteobacteria)]|nr:PAS domain S-box protein [Halofilum sp. (in: g-proteobacteria)]